MKKLVIVACIVFLLVSCDAFNQSSTVTNDSSQQISFQWSRNSSAIITLDPGQSESLNYGFSRVYNLQPDKRVKQEWSSGNLITITDIIPFEVRAYNTLSFTVTLAAGGWMENMNIGSGLTRSSWIYTNRPNFIVWSSTYPAFVEYQFRNNIFFVRIF